MATMTVKTDDIDGTPATGRVTFTVNGVTYGLDLNDANQAAFAADVAKWIERAPKPSEGSRTSGGSGLGQLNGRNIGKAEVRRWVDERGVDALVKQYPELEGKLPLGQHYVPPVLAQLYAAEKAAAAPEGGRPVPTEPPAAKPEAPAQEAKPATPKPGPARKPAAAKTAAK